MAKEKLEQRDTAAAVDLFRVSIYFSSCSCCHTKKVAATFSLQKC
jgi:cytochrome c5